MAVGLIGLVDNVAGNNGGDIGSKFVAAPSSGTGCNLEMFRGGDNDDGDALDDTGWVCASVVERDVTAAAVVVDLVVFRGEEVDGTSADV